MFDKPVWEKMSWKLDFSVFRDNMRRDLGAMKIDHILEEFCCKVKVKNYKDSWNNSSNDKDEAW
jgi:hypothetical protein